jgi:hypothetical protein
MKFYNQSLNPFRDEGRVIMEFKDCKEKLSREVASEKLKSWQPPIVTVLEVSETRQGFTNPSSDTAFGLS